MEMAFLVSLLSPQDSLHPKANALAQAYNQHQWVITDAMIFETLNWFSKFSPSIVYVADFLEGLFSHPRVDVVTGGRNWLIASTEFYRKRKDKA